MIEVTKSSVIQYEKLATNSKVLPQQLDIKTIQNLQDIFQLKIPQITKKKNNNKLQRFPPPPPSLGPLDAPPLDTLPLP